MPWKVDRHSRVMPVASTIVSASTASTTQAMKTVRISGRAFSNLLGLVRENVRVTSDQDPTENPAAVTAPGRAGCC